MIRQSRFVFQLSPFFRYLSLPQISSKSTRFRSFGMEFKYPTARRDDTACDEYHGVKVPDPYRWLEDPDSKETKEFVRLQNDISIPYLKSCGAREKLNKRITSLWNYPKYGCPFKEGKYYYYFKNTGLQNHSVLYQQETVDGEARVFMDPNKLSKDGLISLSLYEFSEDGEFMAYGLSEKGSDWSKIKIKRVSDQEDFPEVLEKVKFSEVSWTHDNKGFFYSRYPDADDSADGRETTTQKNHTAFYHRLGTQQSEDVACTEFPDHPDWMVGVSVTNCGHYVIVGVEESTKNNMIYYCDLRSLPNGISGILPLKCIIDNFEADYTYIDNDGSIFTFQTDKDAPLNKVITIDFENPDKANWKTVIPEHSKDVIKWTVCVNKDKLLACYMQDVKSVLKLHDLKTGDHLHTFPLEVGNIVGESGKKKLSEVFFQFMSFLTPGIIYHFDLEKSYEVQEFRRINIPGFDASDFETSQVFYSSKDGTKIPMFVVHKKGLVLDGSAPCLLYGYGGFNISLLPSFSISRIVLMSHLGGVFAMPNLRGGGEYGVDWHSAGKLFKKQNCFDDCHAAAEYLIANKYTSAKKIALQGGSNGGLLVCACVNQRPDLFGCGISQVGVLDMLKYHKFTIGYAWKTDYGSSEDHEHFHNLMKYSPLHNIRVPENEHVQYPALLTMTADHDDRVVPLHTLKFTAQLQHVFRDCQKQTNPLLTRVDVECGHGGGKPTSKTIEELTDVYCFLINSLGLQYSE